MSQPLPPLPAKLVIGLFTGDKHRLSPVLERLADVFGEPDLISPWFPFHYTRYYEPEMGPGLSRRMAAFKPLIHQSSLAAVKRKTNALEASFADGGRRRINIDPGYLLRERFVLATGKNFTHRIYIGGRIYADLTLVYQKGDFRALPWTYPDYQAPSLLAFLRRVRQKYIHDLSEMTPP